MNKRFYGSFDDEIKQKFKYLNTCIIKVSHTKYNCNQFGLTIYYQKTKINVFEYFKIILSLKNIGSLLI